MFWPNFIYIYFKNLFAVLVFVCRLSRIEEKCEAWVCMTFARLPSVTLMSVWPRLGIHTVTDGFSEQTCLSHQLSASLTRDSAADRACQFVVTAALWVTALWVLAELKNQKWLDSLVFKRFWFCYLNGKAWFSWIHVKCSIACSKRRTYAEQSIGRVLTLKVQQVWEICVQLPLLHKLFLPEPTKCSDLGLFVLDCQILMIGLDVTFTMDSVSRSGWPAGCNSLIFHKLLV